MPVIDVKGLIADNENLCRKRCLTLTFPLGIKYPKS